jgi:hypothetical protein
MIRNFLSRYRVLTVILVLAGIGVALYLWSDSYEQQSAKLHRQHLQGTWVADELNIEGEEPTALSGNLRLVIKGDTFACYDQDKLLSAGTFQVKFENPGLTRQVFMFAVEHTEGRGQGVAATYVANWLPAMGVPDSVDVHCFWVGDGAPEVDRPRVFGAEEGKRNKKISMRWTRPGQTRGHISTVRPAVP